MSEIIQSVRDPLALLTLVLLLVFTTLRFLAGRGGSKHLSRLSNFFMAFTVLCLLLIGVIYLLGRKVNLSQNIVVAVVDADGRPVLNGGISLSPRGIVALDATGHADVPRSWFSEHRIETVEVYSTDGLSSTATLDGGGPSTQTVTLGKGPNIIRARVTDEDGNPMKFVGSKLMDGGREVQLGITREDGSVSFKLPSERSLQSLSVMVETPNYESVIAPITDPKAVTQVVVRAKRLRFRLTVLDEHTSQSISGCTVEAIGGDQKVSDANGGCDFDVNLAKLPNVVLRIQKPGYYFTTLAVPQNAPHDQIARLTPR